MPGSPFPALGSTVLTLAVAGAVALATAVATHRLDARVRTPGTLAAVVGVLHAIAALAVWAGVRHWGPVVFPDYRGPLLLAVWVLGAFAVLSLQVAVPAYSHVRWRLVTALPALFLSTAATWYQFLLVGGETDVLWLWVIGFGPILIVGTIAVLGTEAGIRRAVGR